MLAYGTHLRKNDEQHKLKYDSLSCFTLPFRSLHITGTEIYPHWCRGDSGEERMSKFFNSKFGD